MWPFKRHRDPQADKSVQAVEAANGALTEITDRHAEVSAVAKDLKHLRQNNHFAESLTRIMTERDR